ncbi:hypothetical protein GQ44DRAFT_729447 [Phaeosphaeriaceae sp. PMI808]|nr:hypothetical protein GQ44DRAFT_729447 [Phaeosphaeriaceae sp. PMI808]
MSSINSEHLNDIYEKEAKELEPWKDSPGEILRDDWRDFLRKREYQRAFLDFFEDQLVSTRYNLQELLDEYLFGGKEPLINGLISGLAHPLIHLGYAYELESRIVAIEALTLSACFYNPLHKWSERTNALTSSLCICLLQVICVGQDSLVEGHDSKGRDWKHVVHNALNGPHSKDAHYVKSLRCLKVCAETWGDKKKLFTKAAIKFADEFGGWGGFGTEEDSARLAYPVNQQVTGYEPGALRPGCLRLNLSLISVPSLSLMPLATIALKYSELYELVSGGSDKATTREATKQRDVLNNKALVMLISSVSKDLTITVITCETAAAAWARLAEQFDRNTSNLTIYQFRSLTSLRYVDGDDLKLHINTFHQLWHHLSKKCHASKQTIATAMAPLFSSDDVKGAFFLSTLPDTLDHVIDTFSTLEISAYSKMEPKILDIAEKFSLNVSKGSSNAYSAAARQKSSARESRRRPFSTPPYTPQL